MTKKELGIELYNILKIYQTGFSEKTYVDTLDSTDVLMEVFGITQELKKENKQYWGGQLGRCWERLVVELCRDTCPTYRKSPRYGDDEPCYLIVGLDAIDTKYRTGSGDSGTLKKFKQYGKLLISEGYRPIILLIREDNLQAPITALKKGGWTVYKGQQTFAYLYKKDRL